MILAYQPVICFADCADRGIGQNPKDREGIFPYLSLGVDVKGADASVIGPANTEIAGNLAQIGVLGGKDAAIRQGNVEQAAEKIFEHCPIVREQPANLASIAFEPSDAFSREVEYQPDVFLLSRGDLEHVAESGDFVASNNAIGGSHLGSKGYHRYGKRYPAARIAVGALGVVKRVPAWDMAGGASEQSAERTAEGQIASAGDNAANKAHLVRRNSVLMVN